MRVLVAFLAAFPAMAYAQAARVDFDPASVMWALPKGRSSVEGEAFLKTRGGDVKTCAGNQVLLVPDSPYARARMKLLFGSEEGGLLGSHRSFAQLAAEDPDFARARFKTTCTSTGRFKFGALTAGRYYLITTVTWSAVGQTWGGRAELNEQGGELMLRVDLAETEQQAVIMTR